MKHLRRKLVLFAGAVCLLLLVVPLATRISGSYTVPWHPTPFVDTVLRRAVTESLPKGDAIPQASSRIRNIQQELTCLMRQSQWAAGSRNARLMAGSTCAPSRYSPNRDATRSLKHVCSMIRGKNVLVVGSSMSYFLHNIWLHKLAPFDGHPHTCLGIDVCTWHHICLPPGVNSTLESSGRFKVAPTDEDLLRTDSALFRYVLSDTLHPSSKPWDAAFQIPTVDPSTGVRLRESFWIGRARASQVIVLSRPPVPAPAWTHDSTSAGNWSFLHGLPIDESLAAILDTDADAPREGTLSLRQILILNAALHATVSVFLPSVLQTLQKIQIEPLVRAQTLLWHGNWYTYPSCGRYQKSSTTNMMFPLGDDPWILYHNFQGTMSVTPSSIV
ncbi:hypothetical protein PLEOSDRAFT_1104655 [Pleurotus ostreatus PC15]|uniref:Uncharacterized protein n=1 Tax=Pleurotus ostreatus (strain PC15) TaxID=1137138 RepID=A0A067NIY0_PLEO1|nr:hypothetical protein PLEOSDRAFT_1104655 [Pleurotus ostreatus PC15]